MTRMYVKMFLMEGKVYEALVEIQYHVMDIGKLRVNNSGHNECTIGLVTSEWVPRGWFSSVGSRISTMKLWYLG